MLPGGSVGPHGRLAAGPALAVILVAAILSLALYWVLTLPFKEQEKTQQGTNSFEDWLTHQTWKDGEKASPENRLQPARNPLAEGGAVPDQKAAE